MNKITYKLPQSWVLTSIGQVGIVTSGGTPSTHNPEYWGGEIPWVTPADLSNYSAKYISKGLRNISMLGLNYSSANLLPSGSILFSSRAPIGYVVMAKNPIATNQGFKNFIPTKSICNDYVYYYLKSIKSIAEKMASGTTFLELSATKFSQIPFPLPPLKEQYRIVAKIEEIFSELEHAEDNLRKAKRQLEVYEQAMLKSAFQDESLSNKSFRKCKLKEIVLNIQYGYTAKSSVNITGPKFLRITDIQNKKVAWESVPSCKIEKEDFKKYSLKIGDILFARSGNTVGKSYLISQKPPKSVFASYLIRVISDEKKVLPSYLYLYFQTQEYWGQINSNLSGTGQPNFNGKKLSELIIPLCDKKKQIQIVQNLEYNFSIIENLRKAIQTGLKQCEVYRHSILKKAFEGRLINQTERDEPAKELLNKIKLEIDIYLNEIKINKKMNPKIKPPKKSLGEILNETFKGAEFTYEEIRQHIVMPYEEFKIQFYELLEKGEMLTSSFNPKKEKVVYTFTK